MRAGNLRRDAAASDRRRDERRRRAGGGPHEELRGVAGGLLSQGSRGVGGEPRLDAVWGAAGGDLPRADQKKLRLHAFYRRAGPPGGWGILRDLRRAEKLLRLLPPG